MRADEPTEALELRGREPGDYYRTWRLLGVGSVGTVYEALDRDGRKWAVKVLHAMPGGEASVLRFQRSAGAALTLAHPNIARVEDFIVRRGEPAFL